MIDSWGYQNNDDRECMEELETELVQETVDTNPLRCIVEVRFPGRGTPLNYYNDCFDIHIGDAVYVDGKMAGVKGRVTAVSRHFKIHPSDYRKIICRVDTNVHGKFDLVRSFFMTFARNTLPYEKVRPWFFAPGEEEYIVGQDDFSFDLEELELMTGSTAIAERGYNYYRDDHVVYLSLDRYKGRAIVRGTEYYEVEFTLENRIITDITCTCPCTYPCKHEYAAMLLLRELLLEIEEHFADCDDYFAAMERNTLLSMAGNGNNRGCLVI